MQVMSKKYTTEQIDYLRHGYQTMNVRDLTKEFNTRFGSARTEIAIASILKKHGITCGRRPRGRLISRRRLFTDEHEQFIRDNCAHVSKRELVSLFNERFGMKITVEQLKTLMANRKINSGRTGYFPKGHRPWNHGTKGQGLTGPNSGSYKKGHAPANLKPLWHERSCPKDGYILMKVPEQDPHTGFPTRYKQKHVWIWEQAHGPVPPDHVVAFIDGDKTHCDLSNLMMIPRAELLVLNQLGYGPAPAEIKPSILALARLRATAFGKEKTCK